MAGAVSPVTTAPIRARIMKSYVKKLMSGRAPDAGPVERGVRVYVVVVGLGVVAGRRGWRSIVDDLAVVHDHGPAHRRRERAEFVCDQQDAAAALDEPGQRGGERLLADRVDAGGRLV